MRSNTSLFQNLDDCRRDARPEFLNFKNRVDDRIREWHIHKSNNPDSFLHIYEKRYWANLIADMKSHVAEHPDPLSFTDARITIFYTGKLAQSCFITNTVLAEMRLLSFGWIVDLAVELKSQLDLLDRLTKDDLITVSQLFSGLGMLAKACLLPLALPHGYFFIWELAKKFYDNVTNYFNQNTADFSGSLKFINGFCHGINFFLKSPLGSEASYQYAWPIFENFVVLYSTIQNELFKQEYNCDLVSRELEGCVYSIMSIYYLYGIEYNPLHHDSRVVECSNNSDAIRRAVETAKKYIALDNRRNEKRRLREQQPHTSGLFARMTPSSQPPPFATPTATHHPFDIQ